MSDRATQSDHNKDEVPGKCLRPYQSVWISHWKQKYSRSVDDAHNQLSHGPASGTNSDRYKHRTSVSGPDIESDSSKIVKELREIHNTVMNESSTSWESLRLGTSKTQLFPMFKSSEHGEGDFSLKNGEPSINQGGVLRSRIGPASGCDVFLGPTDKSFRSMLATTPSEPEIQSIESSFEPEGIASNPEQQLKSNNLLEKSSAVVSGHAKYELLGSTSSDVPLEFNSKRTLTESFSFKQDCVNQTSSNFVVHKEKVDKNASLLMHDTSTSDDRLRDFLGGKCQNVPNCGLSLIGAREAVLYDGSLELPRNPSSVHGVETTRICAAVDSVQDFTRGPPEFSQTTHHFLITKGTNVNLSSGGQVFGESISTKLKRELPSELLSFSPDFSFNVKQVKLQPVDSSMESEGKEKVENVYAAVDLENESSAETDIMDMDMLRKNHLSDAAPCIANKDINEALKSPTSEAAIASIKEETARLPNIELPDINQELHPIPSATSSSDDGSTSRTQSMDIEHFLSHAEHPTNLKSTVCTDGLLELDPWSRWVKRLKPSSSDSFGHGTKISKMVEASSHEKVNKFFSKMLNCSRSSSEPKINKSFNKEHMVIERAADFLSNTESFSIESVRESREKTLPLSWIRRWCHNPPASSKKKHEAVAGYEPHRSKTTQDNFQKKQFPSIAAMALMGKAVSDFRPCEFRKMGTFVVWNTQG